MVEKDSSLRGEPCAGDVVAGAPATSPANFWPRTTSARLWSGQHCLEGPPVRLRPARAAAHFHEERLKIEQRVCRPRKNIAEQKTQRGDSGRHRRDRHHRAGGLTNGLSRSCAARSCRPLRCLALIPIYVLNVAYPLCRGCEGLLRRQACGARGRGGSRPTTRRADQCRRRRRGSANRVMGKALLAQRRNYTSEAFLRGIVVLENVPRHRCRRRRRARCGRRESRLPVRGDIGPRPRMPFRSGRFRRHQTGAARNRADPYQRAILAAIVATFAPFARQSIWLRDVVVQPRRGSVETWKNSNDDHGRRRFWNGSSTASPRTCQQGRRRLP